MKITIQEVAKKANVSTATVSRVMNGNYPVKAETKETVLRVIKELNYIPNMQARELTKQTSTTVGVVVPSINNMFFTEVINGIENYLKQSSLSIMLTCTNNNSDDEKSCINNLISRNVCGIIVICPKSNVIKSNFYDSISSNIPLVFINSEISSKNISCIRNDEAIGAKIALEYLLNKNHRDILFIRGRDTFSYDIKEKVYKTIMESNGVFSESNIINIGNGNISETVDNTLNIMLSVLPTSKCTAVFACNDLMAVGVLNACKKLNISVPADMSIIGYDNIPLSKFVEPKLTTVDQNTFELGYKSAELLLDKINNNIKNNEIILENKLIKRESTK